VDDQVPEAHLIGSGLVAELVGGHGVDGGEMFFCRPARDVRSTVLTGFLTGAAVLSTCCGSRGGRWSCPSAPEQNWQKRMQNERERILFIFEFPSLI